MMRTILPAILILISAAGCATRPVPESESVANPVDALEDDYAKILVELAARDQPMPEETPVADRPKIRSERQLLAALRSLIAQTRMAQSVLADPALKTQAGKLLNEAQATEAALFKQLFVTAP
jgi:hypothetical protein